MSRRYISKFCRRMVQDADDVQLDIPVRITHRAMVFDRLDDAVGYFLPWPPG